MRGRLYSVTLSALHVTEQDTAGSTTGAVVAFCGLAWELLYVGMMFMLIDN